MLQAYQRAAMRLKQALEDASSHKGPSGPSVRAITEVHDPLPHETFLAAHESSDEAQALDLPVAQSGSCITAYATYSGEWPPASHSYVQSPQQAVRQTLLALHRYDRYAVLNSLFLLKV